MRRGLQRVALKHGKPVMFGVLTTDTIEQALERAAPDQGNKGFDVAWACSTCSTWSDRYVALAGAGRWLRPPQWEPSRRARRRALQALYQWQLTGQSAHEITTQFLDTQDFCRCGRGAVQAPAAAASSTSEEALVADSAAVAGPAV